MDLERGPDGSLPRGEGYNLVEGAALRIPNGPRFIGGRGSWTGALLRISTFKLNFDPDRSSYFQGMVNLYPGAETLAPAFVQLGDRQHADQHQLLAIEDKESVFVADRGQRYIKVTCNAGSLSVTPALKTELGYFLVKRAEAKLYDVKSLMWTWHTLDRLHLGHLWSKVLQDRLRLLQIK